MSNRERKRSRWAPRDPTPVSSAEPITSAPSVSDDAALQALMASASKRDEERGRNAGHNKKQRRDGHRDDGPRRYRSGHSRDENQDRRDRRDRQDGNRRRNQDEQKPHKIPTDGYYGPADGSKNNKGGHDNDKGAEEEAKAPAIKPNFGLSGALAKDDTNTDTKIKFSEPPEARIPNTQWRLYVFKGDENVQTLHVSRESAYLMGRDQEVVDIPLLHGSCSSQHAVLQYRFVDQQCRPYLMDLESTNGSFINGVRIESARYYQLKKGDVLKFGASTREYVLLTANTTRLDS